MFIRAFKKWVCSLGEGCRFESLWYWGVVEINDIVKEENVEGKERLIWERNLE